MLNYSEERFTDLCDLLASPWKDRLVGWRMQQMKEGVSRRDLVNVGSHSFSNPFDFAVCLQFFIEQWGIGERGGKKAVSSIPGVLDVNVTAYETSFSNAWREMQWPSDMMGWNWWMDQLWSDAYHCLRSRAGLGGGLSLCSLCFADLNSSKLRKKLKQIPERLRLHKQECICLSKCFPRGQ